MTSSHTEDRDARKGAKHLNYGDSGVWRSYPSLVLSPCVCLRGSCLTCTLARKRRKGLAGLVLRHCYSQSSHLFVLLTVFLENVVYLFTAVDAKSKCLLLLTFKKAGESLQSKLFTVAKLETCLKTQWIDGNLFSIFTSMILSIKLNSQ